MKVLLAMETAKLILTRLSRRNDRSKTMKSCQMHTQESKTKREKMPSGKFIRTKLFFIPGHIIIYLEISSLYE